MEIKTLIFFLSVYMMCLNAEHEQNKTVLFFLLVSRRKVAALIKLCRENLTSCGEFIC